MEFAILGPLLVTDGDDVIELRASKVRSLLAALILNANRSVSSDRLVDALWGDRPPESSANTLQTYVSHLRKALGPGGTNLIVTRGGGYVLAVELTQVDAFRFEQLVAQGREALRGHDIEAGVDALRAALALWRGPALADFAYDAFAADAIIRLEELHLTVVEERIEGELSLGHHHEMAGELSQLVRLHPLRERLWSQHIVALYRCGRQGDALRAYSELRRILGEELGIEPSPQLQRLERNVLLQDPELDWHSLPGSTSASLRPTTPSHNLPILRSSFVGRGDEMAELDKLTDTSALVTIVGPGGSGKSRLAVETARSLVDRYRGGVWLVELARVSEPAAVPEAVATVVGVRADLGRSLVATLAEALDHDALLLLDNCEHLVDACAELVDGLLRSASTLTVLATSREPLRLDAEVLWRIPTLEVPEDDLAAADALAQFDAVRLFVDRATGQGSFAWGQANSGAVARVCRRLDGLPLALELAAARTRAMTPAMIADRLDERFALLTTGSRTALARHQTLRAAVDWSHDLLSVAERVLFRRLSVFAGGFDVTAVEHVCSDELLPERDVLEVLAMLVDRSLVFNKERNGDVRYGMHETLAAYGVDRIREAGEETAFRCRHLAWALAFAESFGEALGAQRVTNRMTMDRLECELDNIRLALGWATASDPQAALMLVTAVGPFWRKRGYDEECKRWSDAVLLAAPDGPLALRAEIMLGAGLLNRPRSEVLLLLEDALASFQALGDAANTAIALRKLSWVAVDYEGDVARAERLIRESTAIQAEHGMDHLLSEGLAELALLTLRSGDESTAQGFLDQALAYNLSHPAEPCPVLTEIAGQVALLRGDFEEAEALLREAVEHHRSAGQYAFLSRALWWLGELALLKGDDDGARRCFGEQLATARQHGTWPWIRHGLRGLARLAIRHGSLELARSVLKEAFRLSCDYQGVLFPEDFESVAALLTKEGRPDEAARLLGAASAQRDLLGTPLPPAYRHEHAALVSVVQSAIGVPAFTAEFSQGRQEAPDEILQATGFRTT